jgi:hypothetical protein
MASRRGSSACGRLPSHPTKWLPCLPRPNTRLPGNPAARIGACDSCRSHLRLPHPLERVPARTRSALGEAQRPSFHLAIADASAETAENGLARDPNGSWRSFCKGPNCQRSCTSSRSISPAANGCMCTRRDTNADGAAGNEPRAFVPATVSALLFRILCVVRCASATPATLASGCLYLRGHDAVKGKS